MIMIWTGFLLLALVVWLVFVSNSLVRLTNRADAAWADIDVQLKRRYDVVPNLVGVVKGYAAHERGTFEKVAAARAVAMDAYSPASKSQAEPGLVSGLRSVFALAEAYPALKANDEFLKLQAALTDIENCLQSARRYYNAVVRDLNTRPQIFPNNMMAPLFGVRKREYFQLDNAEEAEAVSVNLAGES
jgi:LemA protein